MITEFEAKMADRMCEKFGDDFDTYFLVSARPTDKGYCPPSVGQTDPPLQVLTSLQVLTTLQVLTMQQ